VNDRSVERNALLLFLTTLRNNLQPDLTSALAKDRAKRADAALLRLIAGYDHLPAVRARFANQYSELLAEGRALAAREARVARSGPRMPGRLRTTRCSSEYRSRRVPSRICSSRFAGSKGDQAASDRFDAFLARVVVAEASLRDAYESLVAGVKPVAARAVREVTSAAFERYLRSRPKSPSDLRVKSVIDIPGGRSKRTILVELENQGTPALRTGSPHGHRARCRNQCQRRISSAGSCFETGSSGPGTLWLEVDPGIFGFPFIVFRRMPARRRASSWKARTRRFPRRDVRLPARWPRSTPPEGR